MELKNKTIGFALTGSHCTLDQAVPVMESIADSGANIIPIVTQAVKCRDTKFGPAQKWINKIKEITSEDIIDTIVKAEPIGPGRLLDLLIICPCTGNTMAKIANGIIDETVVMAAKAQLRNDRPVLLAIATNDGLGFNSRNLGTLLVAENVFFVPFGQDNPTAKPNSLVARMDLVESAAEMALDKKQIQPVLIEYCGI